MSVGFVILNYNSFELTAKLAKSVATYSSIDEVIIVDNCSLDNSFMELKKIVSKKISLYKTERNGGYSYGNNFGVDICKKKGYEIAFISNPDVVVPEKTINSMLSLFNTSDYSLLTCLQYEIDGSLGMPAILKRNVYKDDLLDCFFVSRKLMNLLKEDIYVKEKVQEIEMFRGSFFAVKIYDFVEIGGFDENIFLYCEERVLSKKFNDAGKIMAIITDEKFDHMHSMSISKEYSNVYSKMKLLYKSRLYYNKYYQKKNVMQLLILKIAMSISLFEFKIVDVIRGENR